jgi:hypothetical protein
MPGIRRGLQSGGDDTTQVGALERTQRGLGGAALGSDLGTQARKVAVAVSRHAAGAEQGLDRQLLCTGMRQAELHGRVGHQLGQQEEVGRTAARQRGDHVE